MKKVELLAPAGDLEKLKIAYLYGADACYIGGESYSLRANAHNFTIDEIKEATSFAHALGKKLYVTVNIVFHNDELEGIDEYLDALEDAGVDAIIMSDPLLISHIKKRHKKLAIHISTQASTTNIESVKYWLLKGAERVVLAREVTKDEMKQIYDATGASLEVFLHGAMCTCYSGRCVLSNYFTNRDSNRGGCAQVCRFAFEIEDSKNSDIPFCIATKDLNLSNYIKELIETGVSSLKIEGRMRSIYYVATVINSYRRLIDAYYNNIDDEKLLEIEQKHLARVANRESTSQYFLHQADFNDQYYSGRKEESNQDFLGLVKGYDKENGLVTIEQRNYFKVGDSVNIFGPNDTYIDFKIDKIINEDEKEVLCANHPQEIVKIPLSLEIPEFSMMRVKM